MLHARPIPVGAAHMYHGQMYQSVEVYQHDDKNWMVWMSNCATCGDVFQTVTIRPTLGNIHHLTFTRRCKLHTNPGRKVTTDELNGKLRETTTPTRRWKWVRQEPITTESSLSSVRHQLEQWKIPQMMRSCGMKRGMSIEEFEDIYQRFVQHNYQRRNRAGELIFGDEHRAKLWCWYWLRDNGYPSLEYRLRIDPEWHDTGKTRNGTKLLVFTNPLVSETQDGRQEV